MFFLANNVVHVEDILEMHNFGDSLTEAESYNSIIWCHYDSCALKISFDKYNEVNNGFTFMKSFAQIFHKINKSDIFK